MSASENHWSISGAVCLTLETKAEAFCVLIVILMSSTCVLSRVLCFLPPRALLTFCLNCLLPGASSSSILAPSPKADWTSFLSAVLKSVLTSLVDILPPLGNGMIGVLAIIWPALSKILSVIFPVIAFLLGKESLMRIRMSASVNMNTNKSAMTFLAFPAISVKI